MNKIKDEIINSLLDTFEEQVNHPYIDKISINIKDIFGNYDKSVNNQYKEDIDDVIIDLIQDNIIDVVFLFDEFYKVVMNYKQIDNCYKIVKRSNAMFVKYTNIYFLRKVEVNSASVNGFIKRIINDYLNDIEIRNYIDLNNHDECNKLFNALDILSTDLKEFKNNVFPRLEFFDRNLITNVISKLKVITNDFIEFEKIDWA